jgi:hypothetical protein
MRWPSLNRDLARSTLKNYHRRQAEARLTRPRYGPGRQGRPVRLLGA